MIRLSLLCVCALAAFAGAQSRTVTLTANDYTFDAPDSIPAGITTFELVNRGKELHHAQIMRLEHGKTMADVAEALKAHGPPPAWITWIGGPNAGVPDGKTPVTITVSMEPGNYVLICFIPSPDGAPHAMKGMVRPMRVTGSMPDIRQAGAPKADVVMTLYDYNFDVSKPLAAGKQTILVKNTAKQWHEVFIVKLQPGGSAKDMLDWMAAGMKGPPPVMPMGGTAGIGAGLENTLTVTLEPGEYALYCFLPDAKDGKEHAQHGRFKQISVAQ